MSEEHPISKQNEMIERYNSGETARAIAKSMGLDTTSVVRVLKRSGIEIIKRVGKLHPMWKGGKIKKGGAGYIGIWKPDHERADHQGYVYEHTLVMEKMIGRLPVKGKESVHHINLEKTDNEPENLYLCDYGTHIKLHRQLEGLIKPLIQLGILVFDREESKYKVSENAQKVVN